MTSYPAPYRRTAQRLAWRFLPREVRTAIESHCGSPVVGAESQDSGFTPGFASVLSCEDGSRHFVKAASCKAQRLFAESYRLEARKLAALPAAVPAPRLLWAMDGDWVVLGIEYVEGQPPRRPWRAADLDAVLDALETTAEVLTPAPAGLGLDSFETEFAELAGDWGYVEANRPDLPHRRDAAGLAAGFAEVTAGSTLVHTDVRDDNVIMGPGGRAWICDWNWPVVGAPWLDSLFALIGPRGDGLDVEAVIASRPLLREVPAEHVDRVLALLVGYFFRQRDEPVPPTSPYLRTHQAWQGEVCYAWLAERRGWDLGGYEPRW